ncbi:hypothetical protein TMatcc_006523 [Talaromyces marneffei ATCC 18224]|uniref:DUF1740-domain-containing protein n=1 Tax=Talaromyces marneffei (strain ATCC 18224 / CBS 334.59 / QM 7333) TaxID=441960 RepID=B6QAC7_TALMQ|nr:conserved hypothetical protein [Talaromyces marneffei ATCC 18224]
MQQEKPVPKFASFKAKPSPTGDVKKSRRADDERRDERSRQRSRHHSHSRRSHSRDRRREQRSHREERPASPAPPPTKDESQDFYTIDRRGDIHNVVYGTIHRYSIPQYHRAGRGGVVGLPSRFKIDRAYDGEDYVVIRTGGWIPDGARQKTKSILARADTKERKVFKLRQKPVTDDQEDLSKGFIPLSHDGSRKRRKMSGGYLSSDVSDDEADKYGYRSIHGKANPEEDIPSDMEASLESDTDEEGSAVRWDREANKQNSELLRRAEDNPRDVDAWVEVIKYQNTLLTGSDISRQLTAAEKRSLADIKVSLYEKALKKVGKHPDKDRLLLGYLEEGATLWESKRLAEQWHAILKHNPGYISLWMRYIDFRQTAFLEFTFERCKDVYLECMDMNASSEVNAEQESTQAYLFLRMTLFMREAGYSELAAGLWQAILEMTLFRPEKYSNSSKVDILNGFASFWDSEVARIGDPGSKGWNSGKSVELESVSNDAQTLLEVESLFSSWSMEERRLSHSSRLPARTADLVENDDPFRVVLWSDIEPFLPFFTSWKDKSILIHEFLKFCYLPPLRQTSTSASGGNAFLRTELVQLSDSSLINMTNARPDEAIQPNPSAIFNVAPLQNMIHSVDTLFSNGNWFRSMQIWKDITNHDQTIIDTEWVRRSLKLLVGAFPQDDELATLALAVEYAIKPNDGKKYAKSLLKKRSASLPLYNTFALMECRSGNLSTASHVWASTFSIAATLSEAQRLEYGSLIRSWVWEYLGQSKPESAVQILSSIPDFTINLETLQQAKQMNMSPAQRLKTERFLIECSDHAVSLQDLTSFTAWTDVIALLHYLLNSVSLPSALEVYTSTFSRLASSSLATESFKSSALELMHQSRSRLVYHHITTKHTYKPSAIRDLFIESTTLFPHNTLLLSLFTWNEFRFRVDERIRSVFHSHPTSSSTEVPITTSLLTILIEVTRPVYTGATIHSARAAFERALQPSSPSGNATPSPSLWKLYIIFELHRTKDISAAQNVFYRAMRACPWSKDILMLAFPTLSPTHKERGAELFVDSDGEEDWWELRRIYNVLLDKELRVHVEIDDQMIEAGEKRWLEREQLRIETRGETSRDKGKRKGKGKGREVVYLPDDPDTE